MSKLLFIIAGPNGSGKTTLAKELLARYNLEFINADDIARAINPDNLQSVRVTAGKKVFKKFDGLLDSGVSFAMETTLSGSYLVKYIYKAKIMGYNVTLLYAYLKSPDTCINRIKIRVKNGGYSVPNEDVIRRYYRSKYNFWFKYRNIVDEWTVFYNGLDKYVIVIKGEPETVEILNEELYNCFIKGITNEQ